jgi:hypothetical protein
MKRSSPVLLGTGIAIVLGTIGLQLLYQLPAIAVLTLINAGTIMIVIGTIDLMKGEKGPVHDERTKKLSMVSMTYSWLSTFIVLSLAFWLDYFSLITVTVSQLIGFLTFWMLVTVTGLQAILKRRGDVSNL